MRLARTFLSAAFAVLVLAPISHAGELAGALTTERITEILANMGYEPVDLGGGSYQVALTRDDLTVYVAVALSSGQTCVWVTTNLGEIADPASLPASVTAKMLEASYDNGPTHFYIRSWGEKKERRSFGAGRALDNKNISPVELRQALEDLVGAVLATRDVWDQTRWQPE